MSYSYPSVVSPPPHPDRLPFLALLPYRSRAAKVGAHVWRPGWQPFLRTERDGEDVEHGARIDWRPGGR